jgi:hypothetical protein
MSFDDLEPARLDELVREAARLRRERAHTIAFRRNALFHKWGDTQCGAQLYLERTITDPFAEDARVPGLSWDPDGVRRNYGYSPSATGFVDIEEFLLGNDLADRYDELLEAVKNSKVAWGMAIHFSAKEDAVVESVEFQGEERELFVFDDVDEHVNAVWDIVREQIEVEVSIFFHRIFGALMKEYDEKYGDLAEWVTPEDVAYAAGEAEAR